MEVTKDYTVLAVVCVVFFVLHEPLAKQHEPPHGLCGTVDFVEFLCFRKRLYLVLQLQRSRDFTLFK